MQEISSKQEISTNNEIKTFKEDHRVKNKPILIAHAPHFIASNFKGLMNPELHLESNIDLSGRFYENYTNSM